MYTQLYMYNPTKERCPIMSSLSKNQSESAIRYNTWASENVFPQGLPEKFSGAWMTSTDPTTEEFALSILAFQDEMDLSTDGKLGTNTLAKIHEWSNKDCEEKEEIPTENFKQLTEEIKAEIVGFTVKFEGGSSKNPYAGVNLDYEYKGYFDRPKRKNGKKVPIKDRTKRHRASKYNPSGGFHIGLSYGAWQAAQEPGSLGQLLKVMHKDDPDLFKEVFGPLWKELIEMTSSRNRRVGKRSSRVQPLGGKDLWEQPWVSRFKEAANHEVFRKSQRKWVASRYLEPALEVAELYNLDSKGDLAVIFDIAIQFGVYGMKKRVRRALKPKGNSTDYDKSDILKVINALPKNHRPRRKHILKDAGQDERYLW